MAELLKHPPRNLHLVLVTRREQRHRLEKWLGLLPPEQVETDPKLLIGKAWLFENRQQRPDGNLPGLPGAAGPAAEALGWAAQHHPAPLTPANRFYLLQMTQTKALIADNTPAGQRKARALLNQLQEYYSTRRPTTGPSSWQSWQPTASISPRRNRS